MRKALIPQAESGRKGYGDNMGNHHDSKIDIADVNRQLSQTNRLLFQLDRKAFERASRIVNSDDLAFYLTASQIDRRYTPLLNKTLRDEFIIPELGSSFVTIGEAATYFMVDFEELYAALSANGFDLEKFQYGIDRLRQDREKYLSVSKSLGGFAFRGNDGGYEVSLADLAQLRNIPFEVLFNEYLLNGMDIDKALKSVETKKRLKEDLDKLSKVVSLPVSGNRLTRYRRMVRSGEKYGIDLHAAIKRGTAGISLDDADALMKMFLINFDTRYIDRAEMAGEDLVRYFKYLHLALTHGTISADEAGELLRFSRYQRLPVYMNTQTFAYLLSGKKDELDFAAAMIRTCIAENELISKREDIHESLLLISEQIEKMRELSGPSAPPSKGSHRRQVLI